jgi:hypothetical protein
MSRIANLTTTRKSADAAVPNFAVAAKLNLTDLIENLRATKEAAETACTVKGDAEKKFGFGRKKSPQVLGGMIDPMMITCGETTFENPASEWFYSSRENIEEDQAKALHKAADAERAEVEKRFAKLLAEWDRQEKINRRAYPKELYAAERAADKALDIWTAAEQALVRYCPMNVAEAVELLALAGRPHKRGTVYLDIDATSLLAIVRNCASILKKELAH